MEPEQLVLNALLEIVWKDEINYGVLKLVSKLFKMRINCGVEGRSIVVNEWTINGGCNSVFIGLLFSICTTLPLTQARMDCALVITHLERDLVVTVDKSLNISAYCSNRAIVI